MRLPSDSELLRELEYELAAVARPRRRPRVRMVHGRSVQRESDWDSFDPSEPPLGTTIVPFFDAGSPRLKPSHPPIIERFARTVTSGMAATPIGSTIRIDVEGHEDETGDPARFGFPGLERAKAVAAVLKRRLVALADRLPSGAGRNVDLIIRSCGPKRPIRSNVTEGGRSWNRRVELRIIRSPRDSPGCS
jgi:outer membrane protein OmpA-like peptidoglycan-associated protein